MFRRSYEDSWRDIDSINDTYARTEDVTNSWSVDKEDSLGHFEEDGDSDAREVDYTTFLEQTAIRDRLHSDKNKPESVASATVTSKNDPVIIETVIEEGVTSFSANPSLAESGKSTARSRAAMSKEEEKEIEGLYAKVSDVRRHRAGDNKVRTGSSSATSSISGSVSSMNSRPPSLPPPLRLSNGSEHDPGKDDIDGDDLHLITSQIQTLEARKSHLGSYEINRVATSPKSPLSPGLTRSIEPKKSGNIRTLSLLISIIWVLLIGSFFFITLYEDFILNPMIDHL